MPNKIDKNQLLSPSKEDIFCKFQWVCLMLFLGLFVLARGSWAATYYVDYSSGADTNNGMSPATPWQHCPGDPRAANNANIILSAGDTVIFKGGVTYLIADTGTSYPGNYIGVNSSGSSNNNRITYDGNSAGTWGTGNAIITDNHGTHDNSGFYSSSTRNYITLKYFTFQNFGGAATLPPDPGYAIPRNPAHAIRFDGGSVGLTVDHCNFSAIGYWYNQKPMDADSVSGVGIQVINASSLVVSNCDFTKVNIAIEYYYTSPVTSITISNCTFHNYIAWGIDFSAGSASAAIDYVDINGCIFHDYNEFDFTNWQGYGEWPHTDGIFMRIDSDGTAYGYHNKIRNNTFYSTSAIAGGSSSIALTNGASADIYNNIFLHSQKTADIYLHGGALPSGPDQKVHIFNNTFLTDYNFAILFAQDGTRPPAGITIENNIFYDYRTGSSNNYILYFESDGPASNWVLDYNVYKSFNTSGYFYRWNGVENGNLTTMQAQGWEAHGLALDPEFLDLTHGIGANVTLNDLRLQSNSPAKDRGNSLSTYFTTDILGVSRPQGPAWDIGAYEYVPGGDTTPPAAPVGLVVN